MSLLNLIGDIFKPAADLIDSLHTSEEERLAARQKMLELQFQASAKAQEYEIKLLEAQSAIISAEAKGESWLQRNWRPLMMVWFGILLGMYWFGFTPENMTQAAIDKLFSLLQIGIGGYVVGRSAEKIAPSVVQAMKKN